MSFSSVTIMGRLVADPDLKVISGDKQVCDFTLATDTGYGDKKKPCFIQANAWGKCGGFVKEWFQKGDPILIDGVLEMDEWQDKESGKKRTKHKIVVNKAVFAGSVKRQNSESQSQDPIPF